MEKKVFLDTNVLIDYLAARRDYLAASITIVFCDYKGYYLA